MRSATQTYRTSVVARVTKNGSGLQTEGSVRNIRDSLPISYTQVETPLCARYASGEANGGSAECFHSERLEKHA